MVKREEVSALKIDEVLQAGDTFLVSFICPYCSGKKLQNFRGIECAECNIDFTDRPCIPPTKKMRLLAGTVRKKRNQIGKRVIRAMLASQGSMCAYCACDLGSEFHIDHIVPVSFGGTNNVSNLCISCARCNLTAGSFVFQDFYQKRDFILGKRFR